MRNVTVKPSRPGLRVLDELSRPYPEEGKSVKRTPWVIRRLKQGDLIEVGAQSKPDPDIKKTKKGGNS